MFGKTKHLPTSQFALPRIYLFLFPLRWMEQQKGKMQPTASSKYPPYSEGTAPPHLLNLLLFMFIYRAFSHIWRITSSSQMRGEPCFWSHAGSYSVMHQYPAWQRRGMSLCCGTICFQKPLWLNQRGNYSPQPVFFSFFPPSKAVR